MPIPVGLVVKNGSKIRSTAFPLSNALKGNAKFFILWPCNSADIQWLAQLTPAAWVGQHPLPSATGRCREVCPQVQDDLLT
jgi:hypothetical protein